jgi:hypothetical protein
MILFAVKFVGYLEKSSPSFGDINMSSKHQWTFFRAGGFDQVKLETGADLMNLDQLDQKLWVALACPTSGLEIDSRTLQFIDTDKNGRVRVAELIAAVKFAGESLKNPDDLLKGEASLPLSAIKDHSPEGKILLASVRQILENIGKKEAIQISIEDVSDRTRIFAGTAFNGDGVITSLSASDAPTGALIGEIIACLGGDLDLSGIQGIGAAKVEAFFTEAKAYRDWQAQGEVGAKTIFPLGREKTSLAVTAMVAIKSKIDDFFGRCSLAAFDPRTESILNRKEEEYLSLITGDLSITVSEIGAFPLAKVISNRSLPLTAGINPAHATAMALFLEETVKPLLGPTESLSEANWHNLQARLAPYQTWVMQKVGLNVARLGNQRLGEILDADMHTKLQILIQKDKSLEAATLAIEQVERLVCYYQNIFLLCTNFVNFKDFYDGSEPSVFQAGTLYLDQRACLLCMRVDDAAKHAAMAGQAGAYLAYLDCTRKETNEVIHIVAAFTAGDSDNLMVGRNGLFYDRKGLDWDATITMIVDNPISIRKAFWSPYKKFARFLEEQINNRAAAADETAQSNLTATATTTVNADKAEPPEAKKMDVGTVAAIGVAAGAIGTFFTALIGYGAGIFKLGILPTLGAIIGLILLISLPSVIMAYMKLRKRNLGPILDANGWAVNAKAKINVPFGTTLTLVAKLPPGSRRDSSDRYAEKGFPWKRLVLAFIAIYGGFRWYTGSFDRVLPEQVRSASVLGKWSPKYEAPIKAP